MAFEDYRIHEQIRLILIREWLDLSRLEYGVSHGVVYVTGTIRRHARCNGNGAGDCLETFLRERIAALPGVREVVIHPEAPGAGGNHAR